MSERERWRQGDLLPLEARRSIGIDDQDARVAVCSHSCDMRRLSGASLFVVDGTYAGSPNGNYRGKTIDTVQLETETGRLITYRIDSLRAIDVATIDRFTPCQEDRHSQAERGMLALWLAQRFNRLALPDEVHNALDKAGINGKLEEALKKDHQGITDVRVRLGTSPDNRPSIAMILLYDEGVSGAKERAQEIAKKIQDRVESKHAILDEALVFHGIHAVSTQSIKYAQVLETLPWRVQYISLRDG